MIIPWCWLKSKAIKMKKLTARDVGKWYQVQALSITFTRNVPKHPHQINPPLHRHHSGFSLQESPSTRSGYACALCKEKRNMFFFL
ncbi:hypothetical protein CRYUN_Cryun05aG0180600 [Craigia yunnanensis]